MKATLEFNLPEEESDFNRSVQGKYLHFALLDFDNQLRSWIKHGHQFSTADEALLEARDFFYKCLENENIKLHD